MTFIIISALSTSKCLFSFIFIRLCNVYINVDVPGLAVGVWIGAFVEIVVQIDKYSRTQVAMVRDMGGVLSFFFTSKNGFVTSVNGLVAY